jgi:hypothetical protein
MTRACLRCLSYVHILHFFFESLIVYYYPKDERKKQQILHAPHCSQPAKYYTFRTTFLSLCLQQVVG